MQGHGHSPDIDPPNPPARAVPARLRATLAQATRPLGLPPLCFGLTAIDGALPGGGLARGALHEVAGSGAEVEHAAAAALFIAGLLGNAPPGALESATPGPVLWVLQHRDLFAPSLAGVGLHPDRVIYAEAPRPEGVLLALEDALRHRGLAGVVGELVGRLTLTASRRLQLAAEATGTPAFLLRRSRRHDDPVLAEPCAAVSRWRVACLPAPPPLPDAPDVPGLGRARWRLDLLRCRGGKPATWIVEACDAQGRLRLPADLPDRPVAARPAVAIRPAIAERADIAARRRRA